MAPSTLRKAIGAVKDQTSIGIAKVASNIASKLEADERWRSDFSRRDLVCYKERKEAGSEGSSHRNRNDRYGGVRYIFRSLSPRPNKYDYGDFKGDNGYGAYGMPRRTRSYGFSIWSTHIKVSASYTSVAKKIDELIAFYNWCKEMSMARSSEYPDVRRITTNSENGSWDAFPSNGQPEVTSAWQTPAADPGKADWELALVESASNLLRQKASLGGGLDPLLLNVMYDQGTVMHHVSIPQLSAGSASRVALLGPGKSTAQVLAFPEPDGTVQNVNQDPFAASFSIPPPSYVQMSDMEKKQHFCCPGTTGLAAICKGWNARSN
ncbi:putative clathrin assembly protein [Hibiscus syriacus]|uniref:Clathrin assembly protein n=1 Tax=Hibiscus syriacus TaxID=106335 RepID=A0A6A3CZD8_HIBSY|nr:putative clathrin assembly protein [Hibiscus syriacus]